jgi:hypothetical protein
MILIDVKSLWIVALGKLSNLSLSHRITTKGNALIDIKVLKVVHAFLPITATPAAGSFELNTITTAQWTLPPR